MFERFTDPTRKVMGLAREETLSFGGEWIGSGHVLLGLAKEGSGIAATVLNNFGLTYDALRQKASERFEKEEKKENPGQLPFTENAKKILEGAMEEAEQLGHDFIGTEHLLLGLLRNRSSHAVEIVESLKEGPEEIREAVHALLGADH